MKSTEWHALLHFIWRENPLYWVARRIERHAIHRWFSDMAIVILAALALWLLAIGIMSLTPSLSRAIWGAVLFELTAWCHLLINLSTFHSERSLQKFEKEHASDMLLTRTSPLWFLLASLPNFLWTRTHISLALLPFYITAFVWGGYSWATFFTMVLFLTLVPRTGLILAMLGFGLLFIRRFGVAFWSQLLDVLAEPIRLVGMPVPTWLLFICLIGLIGIWGLSYKVVTSEPLPSQVRKKFARYGNIIVGIFGFFLMLIIWTFLSFMPFIGAQPIYKVFLSYLITSVLLFYSSAMPVGTSTQLQTSSRDLLTLAHLIVIVLCLLAWFEGESMATVLQIGAVLMLITFARSVGLMWSYRWWASSNRLPLSQYVLVLIWFCACIAILSPTLAPLIGIQGWMVPVAYFLQALHERGVNLGSDSLTLWHEWRIPVGGSVVAVPLWIPAMGVQLGWACLLGRLARSFSPRPAPTDQPSPSTRDPVLKELLRYESRLMARLENPLVNLQLISQRRDTAVLFSARFVIWMTLPTMILCLITPPLRELHGGVFWRFLDGFWTQALFGLSALFLWLIVLLTDVRALYTKSSSPQGSITSEPRFFKFTQPNFHFVLTSLSPSQWAFAMWFPRFWLTVKLGVGFVILMWMGALYKPTLDKVALAMASSATAISTAMLWTMVGALFNFLPRSVESVRVLIAFIVAVAYCTMGGAFTQLSPYLMLFVSLLLSAGIGLLSLPTWYLLLRTTQKHLTPKGYTHWVQTVEQRG